MTQKPANIKVSRKEGILVIEWENGTISTFPLRGLRAACPCAECRGGHQNMGSGSPSMLEQPLPPNASAELESAELTGNYALQLIWKDGHAYGIYSWNYLHELDSDKSHSGSEVEP